MYRIHNPIELDEDTRKDYIGYLEDVGLTEDEAEMMLEDFEMGF